MTCACTIIVRGSNPDYGQIENIHSHRSEVYASLASQLFLKTYADYFQIRIDSTITGYCDNKAYVERLKQFISDRTCGKWHFDKMILRDLAYFLHDF